MTEWTIRRATRRDLSALMAIELAQFPEPWSRRMLLDELTDETSRRYTVATQGRTIVGYLGGMFVLDELHINTIGVLPGWERRGIATALLDELWPVALARGATRATLEVAVSNAPARALYQRFGFRPVGVRRNYYPVVGEDALVLWADIVLDRTEVTS